LPALDLRSLPVSSRWVGSPRPHRRSPLAFPALTLRLHVGQCAAAASPTLRKVSTVCSGLDRVYLVVGTPRPPSLLIAASPVLLPRLLEVAAPVRWPRVLPGGLCHPGQWFSCSRILPLSQHRPRSHQQSRPEGYDYSCLLSSCDREQGPEVHVVSGCPQNQPPTCCDIYPSRIPCKQETPSQRPVRVPVWATSSTGEPVMRRNLATG
jgi:hypothetical protein